MSLAESTATIICLLFSVLLSTISYCWYVYMYVCMYVCNIPFCVARDGRPQWQTTFVLSYEQPNRNGNFL